MDVQLSKNFWLSEFVKSQAAARHGLDNTPGPKEIEAMTHLSLAVLQKVRDHFGVPVVINSGYRAPRVNQKVGGSKTSQHKFGQAADIEIPGVSNLVLANWIRDNLIFDQVILEAYNPDLGPNSGWVHVSFVANKANRGEVLTALVTPKGMEYHNGILA